MNFAFTAEQDQLRLSLSRLVGNHAVRPPEVTAGPAPFDASAWTALCELGAPGLAVPESVGGVGGTWVELGIAIEEVGRTLLSVPLLSTGVAASAWAAVAPDAAGLAELAAGTRIGAVALLDEPGVGVHASELAGDRWQVSGTKRFVLDGGLAQDVVLTASAERGPVLLAVAAGDPGVALQPIAGLDPTRGLATLVLDQAPATMLGGAAAVAHLRNCYSLALAVESVGAAARCLELIVDHLTTRVQFGRPLGSFQALKHRVADLAVELSAATSAAYYGIWAGSCAPKELAVVAPLAALSASTTFLHIAGEGIQLHGGIGFTWEHVAHLYFKRAKTTELLLGGAPALRRQVFDAAGLGQGRAG